VGQRLTKAEFWKRIEAQERLAEIKGARFPDDTPAKQLRRRAEAIVLPWCFNKHYLPHYFRCEPAPFHLELYEALEAAKRIVVRAPRGHAKSTVVTFAYVLHQLVAARRLKAWQDGTLAAAEPELHTEILAVMDEEIRRRRGLVLADGDLSAADRVAALDALDAMGGLIPLHWDPYVQVVAATVDLAAEFCESIVLELQENPLLLSDWGETWDRAERAIQDFVTATGVRVKAFGMEGSIRGGKHRQWRPTLAIVDDPDSERTVTTRKMRDHQERKLTAAVNYGLEPGSARIFVVGTAVHADCLVCRLTAPRRFDRWLKLRYRAITEAGLPLWPARWTLEALAEEEAEDPEAFAMEMMDRPPSQGNHPFQALQYYSRDTYRDQDLPKVLIFDPSLGRTEKSDYQALVELMGPTAEGKVLVDRVELLRIANPGQLVSTVLAIVAEDRPVAKIIEAIGFQALLEHMLVEAASQAGLVDGGWIPLYTQEQSKDLRIRGLAVPVARGDLLFPDDRSCRPLEDQFLDYPDGKRDGVDAVEMGWRFIKQGQDFGWT